MNADKPTANGSEPYRPKIKLERTVFSRILQVLSLSGVLGSWAVVVGYWPEMAETIPVHFDFSGTPDSYGGKETVLLLPVISLVMYALMSLLGADPSRYNYPFELTEENVRRQYLLSHRFVLLLKAEIALLFLYLTWKVCDIGVGGDEGLGIWFLPVVLTVVLGTVVGYFILAIRSR